jgi:hypothetical protein
MGIPAVLLMAAAAFSLMPARAQLMDTLKNATGGGQGGGSGSLGLPSVGGASSSNIAGMLQYCVQNQLIGGGDGMSVKNTLVDKLGGASKEQQDPGFTSGSRGELQSSGKSFDLSNLGGNVKQQVCNQVLQHARSLI